jgi:hypothetical protein
VSTLPAVSPPSDETELLDRVRELRQRGSGPKQIARALGIRPAAATPLVRRVAQAQQAGLAPAERELLGCWVSPGWSAGLGTSEAPTEWLEAESAPAEAQDAGVSGLAGVVVARRDRGSRATVCGFLLDVHCMGVKNVRGPETVSESALDTWRREFFSAFDSSGVPAPEALARHMVHGSVAFAAGLGLEPHEEFAKAAEYVGEAKGKCPLVFGRDGMPFYVAGPYDDALKVVRTLEKSVGPDGYHYLVSTGPM